MNFFVLLIKVPFFEGCKFCVHPLNIVIKCVFTTKISKFCVSHCSIDNRGSVVEPLLAAFNKYCSIAAPNARGRLCRLGEDDLVLSLVHIWKRSSLSLKVISTCTCHT